MSGNQNSDISNMEPSGTRQGDNEVRILIADDDTLLAERLVDFLSNNGFYTRFARNGLEAKNMLLTWKPDYILIDLFLAEVNALQFLKHLGPTQIGADKIKVIVLSGHSHEANVRECLRAGAIDYLVKPFKYIDLLSRLVLHTQKKRTLEDVDAQAPKSEPDAKYFLHLTDLILREAQKNLQIEETLHNLTRMVAMALKAVRVSIVQCDGENRSGHVLASSDLRQIRQLSLDLNKYPEILYTLNSKKLLALDNLATDPTMSFVTRQNKSIQFNSMIVAPIHIRQNETWGVLSARMSDSKKSLSDAEIRFVQLVAHTVGLTLAKDRGLSKSTKDSKKSA